MQMNAFCATVVPHGSDPLPSLDRIPWIHLNLFRIHVGIGSFNASMVNHNQCSVAASFKVLHPDDAAIFRCIDGTASFAGKIDASMVLITGESTADFAFGRESKGTPSQSGCNLSVFYHGLVLLLILQNVRYVLRRLSVIRDAVAALSEILRNCATAGVVC